MARKVRKILYEVTYHTTSRCIEAKPLMKSDQMKQLMEFVLNIALEKYNFELINYAIMDNHFHFFIRTLKNGDSISRIMQFIKSQYARRYNKIHNRTGPFWNERYTDRIIKENGMNVFNFFWILNYISYNPVKSRYLNDPYTYRFSSAKCYIDENYKPAVKITLHKYFMNLGTSFKDRAYEFLKFENIYRDILIAKLNKALLINNY